VRFYAISPAEYWALTVAEHEALSKYRVEWKRLASEGKQPV